MAQTAEKQSFCNLCADLTIELDSFVLENAKELQEVSIRGKNETKKQLLKLFTKEKNNSINQYKANIDSKNNI
ncbi:MAG: hypothetical protein ACFE9R_04400, partial [Candidatus Hermodarchaeota archaeon]